MEVIFVAQVTILDPHGHRGCVDFLDDTAAPDLEFLLIVASNTCAAGGQFSITVTNLKTGVVIKTFQPPSDSPKTVSTVVRSASTLDAVGVVASLNCPRSGDAHRGLMSISLRDRVSKVASFIGSPVDGQGI